MLELKDDLVVGFWLELCKRFPKNQMIRSPIRNELREYGALITPVRINPGLTTGFKPYVALTDIQDGVGFKVGYTVVYHDEDQITDLRKDKSIAIPIVDLVEKSSWLAQYVNFRLMYDFSKALHNRKFTPLLYVDWDMPIGVFESRNVSRTNRISLGFEFDF